MKNMIARYPGTCADCGRPIRPGDSIAFFGRGHAEHQACAEERGATEETELSATLRSDRVTARRGLSVTRFASGAVVTTNSHGRCEDAPCCGCCS